jgi:hypothetical protein
MTGRYQDAPKMADLKNLIFILQVAYEIKVIISNFPII